MDLYTKVLDLEAGVSTDPYATLQEMIDSGLAWTLQGHYGRMAMQAIEDGHCMFGTESRRDYWGNRIPSRYEVMPGTKGSARYVEMMTRERSLS